MTNNTDKISEKFKQYRDLTEQRTEKIGYLLTYGIAYSTGMTALTTVMAKWAYDQETLREASGYIALATLCGAVTAVIIKHCIQELKETIQLAKKIKTLEEKLSCNKQDEMET